MQNREPSNLPAPMRSEPTVRKYPPPVTLIWPSVFLSGVAIFMSFVLIRGAVTEPNLQLSDFVGYIVVGGVFVGVPIIMLISAVRGGVSSEGRSLELRSGLMTRTIPAEDINAFVEVDSIGRRASRYPYRRAVALRPGSPSDRADRWEDRGAIARRVRQLGFKLGNRQPGDIPISGLMTAFRARARSDNAVQQLKAWHEWALGTHDPGETHR